MSPDTELCQEMEDQLWSELNIDQLCREIKFAFKVRKGVLEYYIKMFKFWLEGLHLNTNGNPSSVFLLLSWLRAQVGQLCLTFLVSSIEFGSSWHSSSQGRKRGKK